MKFTNTDENHAVTFSMVGVGDYFREGDDFYIKIDVDDEDGDYYAVNLETGEGVTIPSDTTVVMVDIKEIIYKEI